jgi:MFS transporter, CP family, cyanate transporter
MFGQAKEKVISNKNFLVYLALLWIAGAGLRLTILATPPVISEIHSDLALSETQVGIISGLPAVLFACAAMLGALFVAKSGATKTLLTGLIVTAVGSASRGAAYDVATMYATTMLTGLGVALMQPALPTLVKEWFPQRTFFATAVYVNGLLLGGEVLPVSIAQPVVMPLVGSWRMAYVFWGGICLAIAAAFYLLAPRQRTHQFGANKTIAWMPDWKSPLLWKLGVMMGCVNAIYFSSNFFIPRYLETIGHSELIGSALVALNLGQIPASIILLFSDSSVPQKRYPYMLSGMSLLLALFGILTMGAAWTVVSAAFIGFSSATVLILMLGLPTIISEPNEIHRASSLMLTVGYACAVIIPVICGFSWDISGKPTYVFIPMSLCATVLIISALKSPIVTTVAPGNELSVNVTSAEGVSE